MWKENNQKKQATEKDTWVQLKLQPAPIQKCILIKNK